MLLWSSKLGDRTLDSFLSCYPNYIAMYIFLRGRGDGKSWGQGLVWTHLSCSMGWGGLQMFLFLINFLHALASISVPGLNIILDFSVGRSRSSQEETNCGAHRQLKSDQLSFETEALLLQWHIPGIDSLFYNAVAVGTIAKKLAWISKEAASSEAKPKPSEEKEGDRWA